MTNTVLPTGKVSRFFSLIRQSIKGGEHDYTQGSLRSAILLLAVPMILELSMESIFAVVDIFFVSKLGSDAIATVGLTESCITIVYSAAIGLSTAATAVVARRVGEKNMEAAAHAGAQVLLLSLVVAIVLSIAGLVFAGDILRLMGAGDSVVREGTGFTRIMLGSSIVVLLLFLINGIYRGAGDAAMAMRSLWIASAINIILCPVLINGWGPFPRLGLEGAAIATVFGRGTGVLYQCWHLRKGRGGIKLHLPQFRWNGPIIRSLANVAWPATLQFIIASGSWIVMARLVAETGGTDASAGYQLAVRNVVFFILPAWGLSNAAATLVGQNLGAGLPERAAGSVLLCTGYNIIFMAFVTLLFVVFPDAVISIFTSEAAIKIHAVKALRIIGAGFVFYGIGLVMMQALNGAGDTRTPTIINFICFWLLQVPLAYLLAKGVKLGPVGAFVAVPVAETAIALSAWWLFKKGRWKKTKV